MYQPTRPVYDPRMKASAARMGAEEDEADPKAPVVPTTNITAPKPQMTAQSAAPTYTTQSVAPTAPATAPASTVPTTRSPAAGTQNPYTVPSSAPGTSGTNPDDLRQAAEESLLSGKPLPTDTSAQDALIKQLYEHNVGEGQRELNARLGAAGFGTSGLLAADSENMRMDAARQAAQDTFTEQNQAQDRARQNLTAGISGSQGDANLAITQKQFADQQASAAQLQHPSFMPDGSGVDPVTGQNQNQWNAGQKISGKPGTRATSGYGTPGSQGNPYVLQPEEVATAQQARWKLSNGMYQDPSTGSYYKTPV